MALQGASEEVKRDREAWMEAVRQPGRWLQDASEDMKHDRTVVMEAVKQNGHALQSASEELKARQGSRDGGGQAEWLGASVCFRGAEA